MSAHVSNIKYKDRIEQQAQLLFPPAGEVQEKLDNQISSNKRQQASRVRTWYLTLNSLNIGNIHQLVCQRMGQ